MKDIAEVKTELQWCLANGMYGPRTEIALRWALDLIEDMEREREEGEVGA